MEYRGLTLNSVLPFIPAEGFASRNTRVTSPNAARTVKRKLFMFVLSPSAPFLPLPAARALPPGVMTASKNNWRGETTADTPSLRNKKREISYVGPCK